MASSGVRENVNLTITPTFVGVCGMLFQIILVGNVYQYCVFFEYFLNVLDQLLECWM